MQNPQHIRYESTPDEDLVSLSQNGDVRAFGELIERHRSTCRKLAFSILRSVEDAEDEVQNACWKAYRHIGQFQRDAKFSTWLTRIVVNQCLMRMRQAQRSRLVFLEDTEIAPAPAPESPEARLAKAELGHVLCHEIGRIPPLLRNVFLLRDVQERPMHEVAAALGITVAAAKSRLLRARQELRNRMQRYEGRLGPATLLAS